MLPTRRSITGIRHRLFTLFLVFVAPMVVRREVRGAEDPVAGSNPWFVRGPMDPSESFEAVAFGAGRFVAVGGHGRVASSVDGTNWTMISTLERRPLHAVIFSPTLQGTGGFVAAGVGGSQLTGAAGGK